MHDDAERWDARYRNAGRPAPQPPDALIERPDLVALLPTSGTAIDVACGLGAQTLWLAGRGLDVTAYDVSPIAVTAVTEAAGAAGLSARVEASVADLDVGLPAHPAVAEVLVCQRFRQPVLYEQFVERLAPGGVGIVTVLSTVGAESPGPFHAPPGELLTAFDRHDTDVLHHAEDGGRATVVFRRR